MTLQCCSAAASARMHNKTGAGLSLLSPGAGHAGSWSLAPGDTVQGAWWRTRGDLEVGEGSGVGVNKY